MKEKRYFVALPDNEDAFYAYINLVVNNKNNSNPIMGNRPKRFGPIKNWSSTRNEVGEPFIEVNNLKDKSILEMFVDQFCLIRTYFMDIEGLIKYVTSDRYDR